MVSLDSLVQNLQESLKSMHSGLELCKPDKNVEAQALASPNAASDPTVVAHFIELLEDWCIKVETYLDDSDRSRWEYDPYPLAHPYLFEHPNPNPLCSQKDQRLGTRHRARVLAPTNAAVDEHY